MNNCEGCPLGMFSTKSKCLTGVGNPMSGKIIVVPNIDREAYKNESMSFSSYVDIITHLLIPSIGRIEELDCYIAPFIRCKLDEKCPITRDIASKCMQYTFAEITQYNIRKVMFMGSAAFYAKFPPTSQTKNLIYLMNGVGYSTNYSPFVKYRDNMKYRDFCNRLTTWYSADKTNNYNGMQIIRVINNDS